MNIKGPKSTASFLVSFVITFILWTGTLGAQTTNSAAARISPSTMTSIGEATRAPSVKGSSPVAPFKPQATEKPLMSKHTNGVTVALVTKSGKLTEGKNSICAVFQSIEDGHPVGAQNVEIEFTLLVGRNRGRLIKAPMTEDTAGRYCGSVALGTQYYFPSNYDVVLRYVDPTLKKRKVSFRLSLG